MIKKLIIPSIVLLTTTYCFAYNTYTKTQIKDEIRNQILETVDSNNLSTSNYQTKKTTQLHFDENESNESYLISIENIYNEKLGKETIDGSTYISYNFDANVVFSKNSSKYAKTIKSKVIFEKDKNSINIKSTDDLEDELLKSLIQIKKENDEDFSEELNNISLLYQNEELDIRVNYPDYYTYSTSKTQNDDATEHNVSFYMDENKLSNYIQMLMISSDTKKSNYYKQELENQGYISEKSNLTTNKDLNFSIFTQTFTQNFKDITEIIYISNSKYKDIDNIIITAKVDSDLLSKKKSEIEEIIKSIS